MVVRSGLGVYLGPADNGFADLLVEVQANGLALAGTRPSARSFGQRLTASLSELVGGKMEFRSDSVTYYRLHIPQEVPGPLAEG